MNANPMNNVTIHIDHIPLEQYPHINNQQNENSTQIHNESKEVINRIKKIKRPSMTPTRLYVFFSLLIIIEIFLQGIFTVVKPSNCNTCDYIYFVHNSNNNCWYNHCLFQTTKKTRYDCLKSEFEFSLLIYNYNYNNHSHALK